MRPRTILAVSAPLLLATLALTSLDPAVSTAAPVASEMLVLQRSVHQGSHEIVRVALVEAARPLIAEGLRPWLHALPLEPAVRDRLLARAAREDVLDELVPFAFSVKELYGDAPAAPLSFDAHARATFAPGSVPGLEHARFRFAEPAAVADRLATAGVAPPAEGAPSRLEIAARTLALYDAVWLRDAPPDAPIGERLACDADDDAALNRRVDAALPEVRALVRAAADGGLTEGDMGVAARRVLEDEATLRTVTTSLVELVDDEVCRHYAVWAARAARQAELRAFLRAELDAPGGGRLWDWLTWRGDRRRAVHVVVDGLEGNLVEALATVPQGHPLLARALDAPPPRPPLASAAPAPATQADFLPYVAGGGAVPDGWLPFFRRLYADARGIARQGISTTPTISVRNLPIAKTGAPVAGPGATGLPNFHFVDRTYRRDGALLGRPWYFYGNDALQLGRLTHASGMRTMFTRLDHLDTMSCGAQYDRGAGFAFDALLALGVGEAVRDWGEALCAGELRRRAAVEPKLRELRAAALGWRSVLGRRHHPWEVLDAWEARNARAEVERLLDELATLEPLGMPDYLLVYNPWPDHFAHADGPFSDAALAPTGELNRLDFWLGRIDAAYRDAGVADRTLFGMAGDHGLTPVAWIVSPEAEVLDGLAAAGTPLRWRKISSDEGEGPKLTDRFAPPSMRGLDLVVASTAGGNYMLDLFLHEGGDEAWARQPRRAELEAYRTVGGATLDVVAEVRDRLGDALEYLAVRETACAPEGGTVTILRRRGGVVEEARIERRRDRLRVERVAGDPLGLDTIVPYRPVGDAERARHAALGARCLAAPANDPAAWCTEAEWRAWGASLARPDVVTQLAHLYDSDRAGTINLFPADGVGFNTKVPGRHAGEHFHEKDAFVGVWGAPLEGAAEGDRLEVAMNGSVAPTLFAWLTGAQTPAEAGWGYAPLALRLR